MLLIATLTYHSVQLVTNHVINLKNYMIKEHANLLRLSYYITAEREFRNLLKRHIKNTVDVSELTT